MGILQLGLCAFLAHLYCAFSIKGHTGVTAFQTIKLSAQFMAPQDLSDQILRKVDQWACIKDCGACCKLGPLDSRPDLKSYLSPEDYERYVSMIGPDDWCVNFDKKSRMCKIYDTRPEFCRVEVARFTRIYEF